jgi:DNA repair photolyase
MKSHRHHPQPSLRVKSVQTSLIQSKTLLTRSSGYLKSVCSHSLNPYSGCGYGLSSCGEGCYVRFNHWLTRGREWGKFVDVKINAGELYLQSAVKEKNWAHRNSTPFTIFMSSSTDPWQPAEKKHRVTRAILQSMTTCPPDTLILQTHSASILDDQKLLLELSRLCSLRAHISIEGDRNRLPGLPPPPCSVDQRISALEQLSAQGLNTVACLSPLYPLKNPQHFFKRLKSAGASAVIIDHFIEGDGSAQGSRTFKTNLPSAMSKVQKDSIQLSYRDYIATIARAYLPVGVSAQGFAGHYTH